MKLEEMKRIAAERTPGDWESSASLVCDQAAHNANFLIMCHENWDKLMAVVDLVKQDHDPFYRHPDCAICKALEALEAE